MTDIKRFSLSFLTVIILCCTGCHKENNTPATSSLTVSMENDPGTLDPRLARQLNTATVLHMLYEGLTRLNKEGVPLLALAENVGISDDRLTYTFTLKQSCWSDGSPVTAGDFEETWKSMLDPSFPAPNAYQLFVIKGAKEAKEGTKPLDQVGIKALDPQTLEVRLDNPTPYFLHLTAAFFYYPVHDKQRQSGAAAADRTPITNGPFRLESRKHQNQLTVVKNGYYWDKESVAPDQVSFILVDNTTALSMFNRKELDWVGSPLSTIPTDALSALKKEKRLSASPAAGVFLLRFNTEKPPFNNVNIRRAFNSALNRQDLVEHVLQGNQTPAQGFVPPPFINRTALFRDNHVTKAKEYFQTALSEQNIDKDKLPPITLLYATGEWNHKIAQVVREQWKAALDVEINLQSYESKIFYDKLQKCDHQIAIGSWFADIGDPISFLEVFKYKNSGTNNTRWESPRYVQLLNFSSQTGDAAERESFLAEAEKVLIDEMPIAPLFYGTYNYLKNPNLKDFYFSELGYLDLKHAIIEK